MKNSKEIVQFETEHFVIRQVTMGDVEDYVAFWNDPDVMRFIGDGTWGGGEERVKQELLKYIAFYEAHPGLGTWAVEDKTTRKVVGEVGLGILAETGEIEAGYVLSKAYWGRGLGTKLLNGLLSHGFSRLKLSEVVAVSHPNNLASIRVLEKCGMAFVGEAFNYGIRVYKYSKKA